MPGPQPRVAERALLGRHGAAEIDDLKRRILAQNDLRITHDAAAMNHGEADGVAGPSPQHRVPCVERGGPA